MLARALCLQIQATQGQEPAGSSPPVLFLGLDVICQNGCHHIRVGNKLFILEEGLSLL